jgi:hypothetical protein
MQHVNGDTNVWKGLVAGLAGGLVASWTMNQFQAAWTRMAEGFEKAHGAQSMQPSEGPNPNDDVLDLSEALGQSEGQSRVNPRASPAKKKSIRTTPQSRRRKSFRETSSVTS